MSVSEFLIKCFYPRQSKSGRGYKKEITFGGVRYPIEQPPRKLFIDNRYKNTDLDDSKQRHPILCSEAHDHWEEGAEWTPSSMTIISDYPYTTLKQRILEGATFGGTHFKHFYGELPTCLCNDTVFEDNEEVLTRRRDEALSASLKQEMCIFFSTVNQKIVKWELGYFNHDSGEFQKIDEVNVSANTQDFPEDKVSFWLKQNERRVGRLPFHCAGHLATESVDDSSRQIKIPDSGELVALVPASRLEKYKESLSSLKNAERIQENGSIVSFEASGGIVKLGKVGTIFTHKDHGFHVATIKWDSTTISFVQEFIKESTGLAPQYVRRTNPLKIEMYDADLDLVTVSDSNTPNLYRCDAGGSMKVRVFRSRNRPLGSFLMKVGPNVNVNFGNDDANRISITPYPIYSNGIKVFKIFVKSPIFEQGIWFELNCNKADDGTWFEVHNNKTSVEASGMRVELFEEE
jgi:hypothetical protein